MEPMSTLSEMQEDMRRGYLWGATGIVTSGVVWLAAAAVAYRGETTRAIWTLLVGAVFIFPLSNLFDRALGAPGKHSAGNPLGRLGGETTIFMIVCIPLAYGLSLYRVEWFFPAVLLIIAGRYATFATLYGTRVYWLLAALLAAGGVIAAWLAAPPFAAAFLGGFVEVAFGTLLLLHVRRAA